MEQGFSREGASVQKDGTTKVLSPRGSRSLRRSHTQYVFHALKASRASATEPEVINSTHEPELVPFRRISAGRWEYEGPGSSPEPTAHIGRTAPRLEELDQEQGPLERHDSFEIRTEHVGYWQHEWELVHSQVWGYRVHDPTRTDDTRGFKSLPKRTLNGDNGSLALK